jgi:hypothetical protein
MIYIISELNDVSTNKVLEWLYFYNKSFIRINTDYDEFNLTMDIEKNEWFLKNVFWIRRGYFPFIKKELKNTIYQKYLRDEYLRINYFIEKHSENIFGAFYKEENNNKLNNLLSAKKAGLNIPRTIISNCKIELVNLIENNKKYVCKPFNNTFSYFDKRIIINGEGTTLLDINKLDDTFSTSLIQEYIEKIFEIRIFFIQDSFYSMAIFSQQDEKTKIDYRNYNLEKPNRCVPFILPKNILNKIKKFVSDNDYSTGSIDLIYSNDNKFFFLEINPMGQFDWLSGNCNYHIEKKIAEILKVYNERY